MRGRDQFLRVGAFPVLKPRGERILRLRQDPAVGRDGAFTGLQVALPDCRAFPLHGSSLCLWNTFSMRPTAGLRKRSAMEPSVQSTIQIECGADQGDMGESLWKVAKGFAATAYFLRIQPHVIGVSQHPFEQQSG